jgi:hypothetical protein
MGNITLQEVWARLAPSYPSWPIGIGLYVIAGFAMLNLLMQKKSEIRITLMLTLVILLCLVDKVAVGNSGEPIGGWTIESFFLRVPMFVFPLITAGMTRWDRARPFGVIGGLIGGVYLFLRWFFEQRNF